MDVLDQNKLDQRIGERLLGVFETEGFLASKTLLDLILLCGRKFKKRRNALVRIMIVKIICIILALQYLGEAVVLK